jgi:hypothetical protein
MANLDDCTIYAFIRQDLPPGQETIQAIHAAFHAGMAFGAEHGNQPGIPFAVVTDTPTLKAVKKAQRKMEAAGIKHYAMVDTDVEEDVTAIVTHPVDSVHKQVLSEYRLRRYYPVAQAHLGNQGGVANSNADLAQLREHSEFNGEVAGAAPAVSSNLGCS